MHVFLSDLHLTDGTCREIITFRAFDKFASIICDMALKANEEKIKEGKALDSVETVLLGDIFDVIRSKYWFRNDSVDPRP